MTERREGSEEFYEMYEMMEDEYQKEKFGEEIRMNKELEKRAIDIEIGEEIAETLADQKLEDMKLSENKQ